MYLLYMCTVVISQRGIKVVRWNEDEKSGPPRPLIFPPSWNEGLSSGSTLCSVLLDFSDRRRAGVVTTCLTLNIYPLTRSLQLYLIRIYAALCSSVRTAMCISPCKFCPTSVPPDTSPAAPFTPPTTMPVQSGGLPFLVSRSAPRENSIRC